MEEEKRFREYKESSGWVWGEDEYRSKKRKEILRGKSY